MDTIHYLDQNRNATERGCGTLVLKKQLLLSLESYRGGIRTVQDLFGGGMVVQLIP